MAKATADLRSLARAHTEMGVRVLAGIALNGTSESARVRAVELLFERGWGRAATTFDDGDGNNAIQVIIRHIVEHAVEPRTLDGRALPRVIDQRRQGGDQGDASPGGAP